MKTTNKNLEAEPGLDVDMVSGEAPFSSTDKLDSGTGCRSTLQSRLRSPSLTSREECREPLCSRCIRLSCQSRPQPGMPLEACGLRLDDDLNRQVARPRHR